MKTHTIRNKNKVNPIISFTPKFLDVLSKENNWVIHCVCAIFLHQYSNLTGIKATIDYETDQYLKKFTCSEVKESNLDLRRIFIDGLKKHSLFDLEELVIIIHRFDEQMEK